LGIGPFCSAIRGTKLNVEVLYFEGMVLNEVPAFFHIAAHQDTKEPVGLAGIVNPDAQQGTSLRIHRRIPQLVGVHLTQTFEAFYLDPFTAYLPDSGTDIAQRGNVVIVLAVDKLELGLQSFARGFRRKSFKSRPNCSLSCLLISFIRRTS